MNNTEQKVETSTEAAIVGNTVLPTVFSSIEEAVKELGLSKRVRWKNYLGYLCKYTKKDICPEFVVKDGLPVQINGR